MAVISSFAARIRPPTGLGYQNECFEQIAPANGVLGVEPALSRSVYRSRDVIAYVFGLPRILRIESPCNLDAMAVAN
jgi:hypothetical protein